MAPACAGEKPVTMKRTISSDLIIGLVVVVGMTSLIAASVNYLIETRKAQATFERKADEYLHYLQESLAIPIWTFDRMNVRKICDALYTNETVHNIRVRSTSGEVFFDKQKAQPSHIIEREGEVVVDGMVVGRISLALTLEAVKNVNLQTLKSNLIITLAALVMMISAARILMRSFLKAPMNDLIRRIDAIADGEYDQFGYNPKQREIASITQKVIYMAGKIQDREKRLSREISERLSAHRALGESEEKYRTLFENSLDAIVITTRTGAFVDVNQSFIRLLGYEKRELMQLDATMLWVDIENRNAWLKTMMHQGGVRDWEMKSRRKDGRELDCLLTATIRRLQSGETHFQTICRDITQYKQTESELRRLRSFLSSIIHSMPSILIGLDPDFLVTHWNKEAELKTGVPADVAVGRIVTEVFPGIADIMDKARQAMREGIVQEAIKTLIKTKDTERYVNITIYPLAASGVAGSVIRIDDVTERVRIEEMMIQSEKMASVGGLAAGMAHEINNPLAGIMQSLSVIERYLDEQRSRNRSAAAESGLELSSVNAFLVKRGVMKMLANIKDSAERAARIVDNMLSFSRKSQAERSEWDISALLDKTLELAENAYDSKKLYDFRKIRIVKEYMPGLPPVQCEAGKIQQVFLNILKNGAQAMAEKNGDDACFFLRTKMEGNRVHIEIEDNGPGMTENIRKRVFEPFFTTKSVNNGTGLGMAVSYFIITEQHGGVFSVVSSPGNGSKFIIKLPVNKT